MRISAEIPITWGMMEKIDRKKWIKLTCECSVTGRNREVWVPGGESIGFQLQGAWRLSSRHVWHQRQAPLSWDVLTWAILAFAGHRADFHPHALSSSSWGYSAIHPPSHHCQSWWVAWGRAGCMHVWPGYPSGLGVVHRVPWAQYRSLPADLPPNSRISVYAQSAGQY